MTDMFGSATLERQGDRVVVTQADPTVAVDPDLWAAMVGTFHRPDDQTLVLDSDGAYRYRLRREQLDAFGHTWLIFDREPA